MFHVVTRGRLVAAIGVSVVVAAMLAACGGGSSSSDSDVASAIDFLDKAGLHGIDESINTDRQVPANAETVFLHAQTVTLLTDWPSEFEDEANALAQTFADAAAAVATDNPDMAKAGEAATKAHDAEHEFSHNIWAHLQSEAGVASAGGEDHDE